MFIAGLYVCKEELEYSPPKVFAFFAILTNKSHHMAKSSTPKFFGCQKQSWWAQMRGENYVRCVVIIGNNSKITKTWQRLLQEITSKLQVKISEGHRGLTFENYIPNDTQFLWKTYGIALHVSSVVRFATDKPYNVKNLNVKYVGCMVKMTSISKDNLHTTPQKKVIIKWKK